MIRQVEPTDAQASIIGARPTDRILVTAGPGTGKTEVLARRLVRLLQYGLSPSQLLVLSFSRNAVRNVTDRVRGIADIDERILVDLRHLVVRTFDSWAFRTLRQSGESAEDLLASSYEANIAKLTEKLKGPKAHLVTNRLSNVRHIIVDELQDLAGWRGELTIELLRTMCPADTGEIGFTLLGDPAQAIYDFSLRREVGRSSTYSATTLLSDIRDYYRESLDERSLELNYRAAQAIADTVEAARAILLGEYSVRQKLEELTRLVAGAPCKELVSIHDRNNAASEPRSLAILCRTNGQALAVANELFGTEEGAPEIPIVVKAGSPSKSVPAWVSATLGRFRSETLSMNSFAKIYQKLYGAQSSEITTFSIPTQDDAWAVLKRAAGSSRGADAVSIKLLRERLRWPDLLPDDEGLPATSIEVTTIHQSKGLEYDEVGILETDGGNHDLPSDDDIALREEANILFVGLSRAGDAFDRLIWDGRKIPRKYTFGKEERVRWCSRNRSGGFWVEMGLTGDVDPTSFVSSDQFESEESAGESQSWLARNATTLRGCKVVLVKWQLPGVKRKYVYRIHLQENGQPARLLGCTRQQLTFDLFAAFKIFKCKGYGLPKHIYNLRIADVISLAGNGDDIASVYNPWNQSGLWVGIRTHGLGFFKKTY